MSRRRRLILIGAGIVAFVMASILLARFLDAENAERDADLAVLRAEARGDAPAILAALRACTSACQGTVRANAAALRGPGDVSILADMSGTAYALTGATGKTRIAWKLPGRLPTVQCLTVRRSGNALTGISVSLLAISPPIPLQSDC
ncbi:MAG: hypothetical protein LC720_04880 [Actinobacteria bacterium]|nr:hypothetical protein [Actinomycetota bacterium]